MFTNVPRSYLIHSAEITRSIQTSISWRRVNKEAEITANHEQASSNELEKNFTVVTSQAIQKPEIEYAMGDIPNPIFSPLDEIADDVPENSWKLIGKNWPDGRFMKFIMFFQAISSKSNSSVQKNHRITGRVT